MTENSEIPVTSKSPVASTASNDKAGDCTVIVTGFTGVEVDSGCPERWRCLFEGTAASSSVLPVLFTVEMTGSFSLLRLSSERRWLAKSESVL